MTTIRIGFIGCGNMGRSLIGGILANGVHVDNVCGADPDARQREIVRATFNIETFEDNLQVAGASDVIVLAVKPQAMRETVTMLAPGLRESQHLLISIAAGIRTSAIENWLANKLPVIRAMPNTPALIQAGATALYANNGVSEQQREIAESIMRSVGTVIWLEQEALMDTVTALSGSGPAYYFLFMEILEQAAYDLGLDLQQARLLTLETAFGAAKMAMESDLDPSELRRQVTSPGGTTEAALSTLELGGIRDLLTRALQSAQQRSVTLADEFGKKE